MMTFDWTISFGNLLTVIGFAISGVFFVMMMRSDIMLLGQRVKSVEEALREVATAAMMAAKVEARVETLDERLNIVSRRLDDFISSSRKSSR